jgi:hypothetical protein
LKLGLVADTHVGPYITPHDVHRATTLLASEGPDIVLLGGDYIAESPRYADLTPDLRIGCFESTAATPSLGTTTRDPGVPAE